MSRSPYRDMLFSRCLCVTSCDKRLAEVVVHMIDTDLPHLTAGEVREGDVPGVCPGGRGLTASGRKAGKV